MSIGVGSLVGPLVGGLMLTYFWWGSVFLLAVPVMALTLALGAVLLPERRDPDAGRPDVPSALLSIIGVLALIQGLKLTAEAGSLDLTSSSLFVALSTTAVERLSVRFPSQLACGNRRHVYRPRQTNLLRRGTRKQGNDHSI